MTSVLYMPDGNKRFAEKNNLSLHEAYYLGGKTLKLFSQFFVVERRADTLIYHAGSYYTPGELIQAWSRFMRPA